MKIQDLFTDELRYDMTINGYVRTQAHPTLPLMIYNYTEKAAYESVWNEVTLTCRGLIINTVTDEVVARPLRKFFNYGQVGAPELDLDAPAIVTDKLDGSLGIVYPTPDGPAVATRGSFTSEQALHATEVLRTRYAGWAPPDGYTVLLEIIYPENRIVLNYGELDDLVLLGGVHIDTGLTGGPTLVTWPGPRAKIFKYRTLAQALAAPPRESAEGLVVHLLRTDDRVKIKQADYVALHKIVTGLTARTVWEHMLTERPLSELIEPLPDEFHGWVRDVAYAIRHDVETRKQWITANYEAALSQLPEGWDPATREGRKDFAAIAARHRDSWALFALLDGKDITLELLRRARPEAFVTPTGRAPSEEDL